MKIFGREPVAVLSTIETALTLVLLMADVSQSTIGYTLAVVTAAFGLIGAWATYDTMLTACVGLVKAILVLGTVFELHLSTAVTGAIIMLITTGLGLVYNRQATSPAVTGSFKTPNTVTGEVTGGGEHAL